MDGHSDAGSAIEVDSNPLPAAPWSNKGPAQAQRERTTRRKRKPMSVPQPSHISRRCNNCGVTKTPQWREGPDGPKTLCNACGVKYSRERQDKSKSRKSRKLKPKTGAKSSATKLSYSSSVTTKKRTRNAARDRQSYDFTFFVSSSTTATSANNPSPMPKMAKIASGAVHGFTGKEYAAALSLVSLAILGTSSVDTHTPSSLDEEGDLSPPPAPRQAHPQPLPTAATPKTRRSKRIARRSCSQYYGGLDTNDWIQHLLEDMEEGTNQQQQRHHHHPQQQPVWNSQQLRKEEDVAMGVPCVWAAMGCFSSSSEYRDPSCCCCRKQGPMKKVADSDMASTASDSAKSDFISAHAKLHD